MPYPSCICDLHHSSWQCRILDPLIKARDGTCVLMDTSRVRFHWATVETQICPTSEQMTARLLSLALTPSWSWRLMYPAANSTLVVGCLEASGRASRDFACGLLPCLLLWCWSWSPCSHHICPFPFSINHQVLLNLPPKYPFNPQLI